MSKFSYIELFAGIGGFRQALDNLGGNCVFASEIDKFAKQSYTALYGDEHLHGDITKIDEKDIPEHDLIVAGIPCQAFSVAGKRLGFEDTRGTLFFDVARIAKEKRPKAIWIENVKGLVGHDKGRTLDVIVQTLNDIDYTVDFEVLNSKYFGVPQNRERIFIIAIRDDLVTQKMAKPWHIEGNTVVPKGKRRISEYEGIKTFNFDWPEQTEVTTRLRDILETEVDEKYYLDEEKTARLVAQLDGETIGGKDGIEWHGDLKTQEKVYPRNYLDVYGVMGTEGVSQCLRTMQGGNREPKIAEVQGMPIREATKKGYAVACEGDAVNFQFPDSKTRRGRVGKQIANTLEASNINQGVVEAQAIDAGLQKGATRIKKDGTSSTIPASYYKGLCGQGRPFVYEPKPRYRIRKLTPLECWRLQGFSDEAHDVVKAAGISDSQRYKQAGNAVTVNVISAIGKRLLPYL